MEWVWKSWPFCATLASQLSFGHIHWAYLNMFQISEEFFIPRRTVMNSKQCTSNKMLALNRMTRVRGTNCGLNSQNCRAMSAFYFLLSSQTLKGKKISTHYFFIFIFFSLRVLVENAFWFFFNKTCSSGLSTVVFHKPTFNIMWLVIHVHCKKYLTVHAAFYF